MSAISPFEENVDESVISIHALDDSLERILKRIRLRAQRRVLWLRKLWSEEEPPGGKFAVAHGEVDTLILDKDSPQVEENWVANDAVAQEITQKLKRVETEILKDNKSKLAELQQLFKLTQQEFDIFQTCLALALDPSLSRIFAYLQDQAIRGYVTTELVARLFGYGRQSSINAESPLRTWKFIDEYEVAPGEPRLLSCDPALSDWLCGKTSIDRVIIGKAYLYSPLSPLDNWPVTETAQFIERKLQTVTRGTIRIVIVGLPGSGRRTMAAAISNRLGFDLLYIDSDEITETQWPDVWLRAQRSTYLYKYTLAWFGKHALQWRWPNSDYSAAVQFVICEPGEIPLKDERYTDSIIDMPTPTMDERRKLLKHYVPHSVAWRKEQINSLLSRHRVTTGVIASLANFCVETVEEAEGVIRELTRQRLGELVQILDCPFTWEDLIIPNHIQQALKDLVFEAKERHVFWENKNIKRLFPQGRGLFALFAGSTPGIGKTMSAQVVAHALQRDLYRINLSTLVSKYVGETSKNISRALSQVPNDEVLLFDEADAAFGKRVELTDANSRFLNSETNHLLQAVEDYRGIVLMATNRRSDIDPAFTRRFRYIIDFPKPDANCRQKIWERLVGELGGNNQLPVLRKGLTTISKEIETTGAQIKFSVLTALLAAHRDNSVLNIEHIVYAINQELRKEGRGLTERDRERLLRDVR